MTKFNPENKEPLSYKEMLELAMKITEQADADQYLQAYMEWQAKRWPDLTGDIIKRACLIDLGYFASHYSQEVQERVERLFASEHPIFGKVKDTATAKEIFQAGFRRGLAESPA